MTALNTIPSTRNKILLTRLLNISNYCNGLIAIVLSNVLLILLHFIERFLQLNGIKINSYNIDITACPRAGFFAS